MAGESPDKSEQRKSSGETAPGEHDPRLAVFRESAARPEPECSDRVDQPTAVFKLPQEESPEAPESPSALEAAEAPEGPQGPESPSPQAPEGDARLRRAVAAWVATADTPDTPEARDEAESSAEAPEAPAGRTGDARTAAEAQADPPAPRKAPEDMPAATTAGEPEPSADEPAAEPEPDADAGASAGSRDGGPAAVAEASGPAPVDGDEPSADEAAASGAGRVAGAAGWTEHAVDLSGTGLKAGDSSADEAAVSGTDKGASGAGTPSAGEGGAAAASRPGADAGRAGGRAAAAAEAEGDAPVARPADVPADADANAPGQAAAERGQREAEASAAAGTADSSDTDADADADADADGDEAPVADGGAAAGRPGADRGAGGDAGAGAEDGAATATATATAATTAPAAGAGAGARDRDAGESSGRGEDKRAGDASGAKGDGGGVDQATAVFKAVRPRQAVDQPTTALKAVGKPESAAERTSTFVPLKRDEVRPPAGRPRSTPGVPAERAASAETRTPALPASPASPAPSESAPLPEAERTRQQPLPPRPPLDLLAELTNTPPPPETPVRVAVRRVKIWAPLVLLLVFVLGVVQAVRPLPEPRLTMTAEQTFTFDGGKPSLPWPENGQAFMAASGVGSLGSSGEQTPVPIASVTKAMTAYVILKEHPLKKGEDGPSIKIDAKGESDGQLDKSDNESTLNTVKEGDTLTLRDALAAIMIPSANNIARQLARWDAGSEEAFVKKMNDAAKDLKMTNTTYTDPSGLDATTVSTAEDQVKLGLELVEMPALTDITKLPTWTDPSGKSWRNWNDLVPYDGALGIKTGSTTKAGGNLLFAAHKQVGETDQLIVGAVLAQHATPILGTAISASKELMLATQDVLASRTLVKKGDVVGTVDDGLGGTTRVVATKDVKAVGWSGLTVKLELSDGGSAVPHSAKAGTEVGLLTVGEGASQVKVPVALQKDLAEPGLGEKLTRVG